MQVISGDAAGLPQGYYGRVTHYRHRVFVEQLGWHLDVKDGAETDQFDRPDTVYVMVEDEAGNIAGCSRLLQTTRPYLLGEVFPQLLNGLPPPRDAAVWELSRFAAMDFNARAATPLAQFSNSATALLMRASVACAAERGAQRLITVSPVGIERLIRRLGIRAHRAGPPMVLDGHAIFACWIEVGGVEPP
ncbi:MAG TPA: acyl-homoserine-lactone synthase [Steroidobacteraceae bacterium]|jgi:N-acyl-L-homoserine lactone synthetase